MAAPSTIDILDISGRWHLNPTLSSPSEAFLTLQGAPWLLRRIIGLVTLDFEYTKLPQAPGSRSPRFHQKTIIRPGGFGSENSFNIDGVAWTEPTPLFGDIRVRCHYANSDEVARDYGLPGLDIADPNNAAIIESVESKAKGWTATSVWAFEVIDGVRRYVKYNTAKKGDKVEKIRMVTIMK
ncbi:hypothetical protein N0V88_004940 [Collariella sp. IMI 366227]|nr:hypothetical protein N0V88_004940 [Collariella sp. IMI 366227]